jgi:hypothetical protein
MSAMKIAACQMVSGPDLGANLVAASRLLESAVAQGAQLAALPEYFCLMGHQDSDKLAYAEALGHGPIQAMLSRAARELRLWIIGGTLPIKAETPDRVRNTTLVFSPSGDCVARYDKIHLFAYDNGRESYDEARVLEPGSQPTAFDAEGLLRPALPGAVPRLQPLRAAGRAGRLHLHDRREALGAAAARPRRREPVLCHRAGPGRQARERPPHLGPQHDRRPLGRGAGRRARRRRRGLR